MGVTLHGRNSGKGDADQVSGSNCKVSLWCM